MTRINQEEYEVLKGLQKKGYEWIARDQVEEHRVFGYLGVYKKEPIKDSENDEWGALGYLKRIADVDFDLFKFIQWTDEEPYNITELIEEYEEHEFVKINQDGRERLDKLFGNESEEAEVNKQELIEYLEKEISNFKPEQMIYDYLTFILKHVKQLETLTPEWIDNNKWNNVNVGVPFVYAGGLQNLLVPKQENIEDIKNESFKEGYGLGLEVANEIAKRDKPVIPQFVADYIENNMESDHPLEEYRFLQESPGHEGIADWANENQIDFCRACDIGYTIEEEPKYRVMNKNVTLLGRINGMMLTTAEILEYYPEHKPTFEFTEQEIKDYDPRYWAFRQPAEELEE